MAMLHDMSFPRTRESTDINNILDARLRGHDEFAGFRV